MLLLREKIRKMPVNIPDKLPAKEILESENVFIMSESRAKVQDIRPLKIAILNLMPIKVNTETHLLRMLSNSPLQVEVTLLSPTGHVSKNTPKSHLDAFYKRFDDVKNHKYDGLIVTGAPIEHLDFEKVSYWNEIKEIYDWADKNVTSSFNICWGAQAAMYHYYGIPKYPLDQKVFGVFEHQVHEKDVPLLRGFDDVFMAPHSRHTTTKVSDVMAHDDITVLSTSAQAGLYLAISKDSRRIFVTGHSEYDPLTLKEEFDRDISRGLDIALPANYFPNNDPTQTPPQRWKSHGNLLYSNWLNYYVYQNTPYDIG
jgi:homoserine O-succinyltransferase/O-acetyltransferase